MFLFTHFTSLATNFQKLCSSFLEVHIFKILKSVMTLAATVTLLRVGIEICQGTWHCEDKKITKNGENNLFSNPCFSGEKNPQYNGGYQP
jgi:hypothetical protein